MFKIWRFCMLSTILFVLVLVSNSSAAGYPGFRELKESECVVLNEEDLQNLPPAWHKYRGFVKTCAMRKSKGTNAKVSIISIWGYDYLEAQKKEMWEDFPLTIIVDDHFNQLGTFPELYPINSPVELSVYYGKWKTEMPTEIRIDVSNPAVGGDYHYAPLVWNDKAKKYNMKDNKYQSGKRSK